MTTDNTNVHYTELKGADAALSDSPAPNVHQLLFHPPSQTSPAAATTTFTIVNPSPISTKPVEHFCRYCKFKGLTIASKIPGKCQAMACYSFLTFILFPISLVACMSEVFYETEHLCGKCHRHIVNIGPCGYGTEE